MSVFIFPSIVITVKNYSCYERGTCSRHTSLFWTKNLIVSLIPEEIMLLVYEKKIVHLVFLRISRSFNSSFSFSVIGLSISLHSSYGSMELLQEKLAVVSSKQIIRINSHKWLQPVVTILLISCIARPTFVAWNPVDNNEDTSDSRLAPLEKSSLS